jgi:hypothetical protein
LAQYIVYSIADNLPLASLYARDILNVKFLNPLPDNYVTHIFSPRITLEPHIALPL